MNVHLGVEHALEGGFHERSEKAVNIIEGLGLTGNLVSELLGLELEQLLRVVELHGRLHGGRGLRVDENLLAVLRDEAARAVAHFE